MRTLVRGMAIAGLGLGALAPLPASAQSSVSASDIESLKQELRQFQERLQQFEQARRAPAPVPIIVPAAQTPLAQAPPPRQREQEIRLEREHPFETAGMSRPELGGFRFSGFFVGSYSYNTHVQIVPEFAGGAQALADPGASNFRFDRFGLAVSKTFAPWLMASAAVDVESHRDKHSHLVSTTESMDRRGCPTGLACERFGAEEATTEATLDKFAVTAIAPYGNGVAVSLGRFDVPFGIERHDEPLNLTATTSEVFQFGRPQRMTGIQASYAFTPWLDASAWVVNRWESETTHDSFDDNNRDKSLGGRIGFTPLRRDTLLNIGLGGFFGPEQDSDNADPRWVVDVDMTWSPLRTLLFAGEFIYGRESGVSFRERGTPVAAPAVSQDNVDWLGFYLLAHWDVLRWLGLSFRYGYFDDQDGARTGVAQTLQSYTIAPVIHLSRLIPDLRPLGVTYTRTRHLIDWVDLKLEYRLNHSSEPVFSDAAAGVAILDADRTGHQIQLQLVVNY